MDFIQECKKRKKLKQNQQKLQQSNLVHSELSIQYNQDQSTLRDNSQCNQQNNITLITNQQERCYCNQEEEKISRVDQKQSKIDDDVSIPIQGDENQSNLQIKIQELNAIDYRKQKAQRFKTIMNLLDDKASQLNISIKTIYKSIKRKEFKHYKREGQIDHKQKIKDFILMHLRQIEQEHPQWFNKIQELKSYFLEILNKIE